MDLSELFIEKYKHLEKAAINAFGFETDGRAIYNLERMPRFRNDRNLISYCRDVRNLLQHNPKIDGKGAVQPSESILSFLDDLINRIENPAMCRDSALKIGKLYYKTPKDTVYPTLEVMDKRGFSHVPILSGGKVVGVLSKNVVFAMIMDGITLDKMEQMAFEDIKGYTSIEKSRGSEVYVFIKENTLIDEAEEMCEAYYKNRYKIGLFFMTENGKPDGKLIGAITPWTILGKKN